MGMDVVAAVVVMLLQGRWRQWWRLRRGCALLMMMVVEGEEMGQSVREGGRHSHSPDRAHCGRIIRLPHHHDTGVMDGAPQSHVMPRLLGGGVTWKSAAEASRCQRREMMVKAGHSSPEEARLTPTEDSSSRHHVLSTVR